jgi:hypothetical protein
VCNYSRYDDVICCYGYAVGPVKTVITEVDIVNLMHIKDVYMLRSLLNSVLCNAVQ